MKSIIFELTMATTGKKENYKIHMFDLFTTVASNPLVNSQTLDGCLRTFVVTIEQDQPELPKADGTPCKISTLVEKALDGIEIMIDSKKISTAEQFKLNRKLRDWHDKRPVVYGGFIPGMKLAVIEDLFKVKLAYLLSKIKESNLAEPV